MVVGYLDSYTFIIDSGASSHMASLRYFFSSMYSDNGPTIRMGDDSEIQAKGIGRIDLEHGYFNNVLFVPELEENILSVFQMTHQ